MDKFLPWLIEQLPISAQTKIQLLKNLEKLYFLLVGTTAAGVHWIVATSYFYLAAPADVATPNHAVIANFVGFCVALLVSTFGHTFLTFAPKTKQQLAKLAASHPQPRMAQATYLVRILLSQAVVGLLSLIWQTMLLWVGARLGFWYPVWLAVVLVLVAVLTFLTSKYIVHKPHKN